jgi:hypothetical protein
MALNLHDSSLAIRVTRWRTYNAAQVVHHSRCRASVRFALAMTVGKLLFPLQNKSSWRPTKPQLKSTRAEKRSLNSSRSYLGNCQWECIQWSKTSTTRFLLVPGGNQHSHRREQSLSRSSKDRPQSWLFLSATYPLVSRFIRSTTHFIGLQFGISKQTTEYIRPYAARSRLGSHRVVAGTGARDKVEFECPSRRFSNQKEG